MDDEKIDRFLNQIEHLGIFIESCSSDSATFYTVAGSLIGIDCKSEVIDLVNEAGFTYKMINPEYIEVIF